MYYIQQNNFAPSNKIWNDAAVIKSQNIKYLFYFLEILQDLENYQNILKKDLDSGNRKRTLLQVQRALIQTQDLGDKKLQIVQVIQDIIENKSRQLELDRMKLGLCMC